MAETPRSYKFIAHNQESPLHDMINFDSLESKCYDQDQGNGSASLESSASLNKTSLYLSSILGRLRPDSSYRENCTDRVFCLSTSKKLLDFGLFLVSIIGNYQAYYYIPHPNSKWLETWAFLIILLLTLTIPIELLLPTLIRNYSLYQMLHLIWIWAFGFLGLEIRLHEMFCEWTKLGIILSTCKLLYLLHLRVDKPDEIMYDKLFFMWYNKTYYNPDYYNQWSLLLTKSL